mgnify:FL=1
MAYEAYRVRRKFSWKGWQLAPQGACGCQCPECTGQVATGCQCPDHNYCACGVKPADYGGDIWIVEAGHPRKDIMLLQRFAIGDASISPVDSLLEQEAYRRLLIPRQDYAPAPVPRELVGATRGRPRKT